MPDKRKSAKSCDISVRKDRADSWPGNPIEENFSRQNMLCVIRGFNSETVVCRLYHVTDVAYMIRGKKTQRRVG